MLTAKTVGAAKSLSRSWTHPQLGWQVRSDAAFRQYSLTTCSQFPPCGLASVYSSHLGRFLPPQKLKSPQRLPNSVLWISFGRGNELQIHHENFLLMNRKHRKLFVDKKSKRCKFMPKSARVVSGCIHCIHILLEIEKGSLQWKTVCEIWICSLATHDQHQQLHACSTAARSKVTPPDRRWGLVKWKVATPTVCRASAR